MRYDLAFFLCCFRSFLGSADIEAETYYETLGVPTDAAPDEIRRAYKRKSLELHPDKIRQRGREPSDEDRAKFNKMKDAYETLSDPHRRETYDALGERGVRWIEDPFRLSPEEIARNFASSSVLDRSKIFAIFVGIAVAIFIVPVLVCLQADEAFGPGANWLLVLVPLWFWNTLGLLYRIRVVQLGTVPRPEGIPEEEWIDPLPPMSRRVADLVQFVLLVTFEVLVALRLDNNLSWKWFVVFIPMYAWEALNLMVSLPLARKRIVTVSELEEELGNPYSELMQAERERVERTCKVVPERDRHEYMLAHIEQFKARQEVAVSVLRITFVLFLLLELDAGISWNWWLVFLPFWLMSCCICCGECQRYSETYASSVEKDPESFGVAGRSSMGEGGVEEGQNVTDTNYGAMGGEGGSSGIGPGTKPEGRSTLSDEEREAIRAELAQSGSRMVGIGCLQCFLVLVACLFVGKIQGADYASLWIISPFLFIAALILCCLGCTIFCVKEMPEGYGAVGDPSATPSAGDEYVPPDIPDRESSTKAPHPKDDNSGDSVKVGGHSGGASTQVSEGSSPTSGSMPSSLLPKEDKEIHELD